MIWVLMYVDDIFVMGNSAADILKAKTDLNNMFAMTYMGTVKYFLGVEFKDLGRRVLMTQEQFVKKILKRFKMDDSKDVRTPTLHAQDLSILDTDPVVAVPYKEAIGALLFLSTRTRPDISFAVSMLSQFAAAPKEKHRIALKRVIRYLQVTQSFGIVYGKGSFESKLQLGRPDHASSDADWASTAED